MLIWCLKRDPPRFLIPLLRHVVPRNDGNCHLKMSDVTGRRVHDLLPQSWMLNCGESNFITKKCVFIESDNFIEGFAVHFDTDGPSTLTETMTGIGMDGIGDTQNLCKPGPPESKVRLYPPEWRR